MMNKSLKTLLQCTTLALTISAGAVFAEGTTFRLGLVNKADEPITRGMEKFSELAREYTDGRVTVKVFDSGHLGNDKELFNQLNTGAIDMGKPSFPILSDVVPEYSVILAGYFYDSWEQQQKLLNAPEFGEKWKDQLLKDANLRVLAYMLQGSRNVTTKGKAPRSPDEFKGMKLRAVPNPMALAVVSGLGASPTPIPFPELFQSLNQGVADGQENPLPTINRAKFYEVQDNLILTNHQLASQPLVIREASWEKLSADDQKAVEKAATEAMAWASDETLKESAELVDGLKEKGMNVIELTADEQAAFKASVQASVLKSFDGKQWKAGFGQSVIDFLK